MKRKRLVTAVLVSIIGLYALTTLVLYFIQDSFVYHPELPTRVVDKTVPAKVGLDVTPLTLTTPDNEKLGAWICKIKQGGKWVLFLHGNASNISDVKFGYTRRYRALNHLGYHVFVIDYRGFGESTGKPSEAGFNTDALTAYRYLTEQLHIPTDSLSIYGYSLGTGVATQLASKQKAAHLYLEAPYTSIPDVGQHYFPLLPIKLIQYTHFNSLAVIDQINMPLTIFHSKDDVQIPYFMGEELLAKAKEPKKLITIATGGHINAPWTDSTTFWAAIGN